MRFEVYEDTGGSYRWRLWSGSNKVASSGESFYSKSNAERGATTFKSNAKSYTYTAFGSGTSWYWHATASNGEKVASGGELLRQQVQRRGFRSQRSRQRRQRDRSVAPKSVASMSWPPPSGRPPAVVRWRSCGDPWMLNCCSADVEHPRGPLCGRPEGSW